MYGYLLLLSSAHTQHFIFIHVFVSHIFNTYFNHW